MSTAAFAIVTSPDKSCRASALRQHRHSNPESMNSRRLSTTLEYHHIHRRRVPFTEVYPVSTNFHIAYTKCVGILGTNMNGVGEWFHRTFSCKLVCFLVALDAAITPHPLRDCFPFAPLHPCDDGLEDISAVCIDPLPLPTWKHFPSGINDVFRLAKSPLGGCSLYVCGTAISAATWLDGGDSGTFMQMFRGSSSPSTIILSLCDAEKTHVSTLIHPMNYRPPHSYFKQTKGGFLRVLPTPDLY